VVFNDIGKVKKNRIIAIFIILFLGYIKKIIGIVILCRGVKKTKASH
jgi:hypothetical protein